MKPLRLFLVVVGLGLFSGCVVSPTPKDVPLDILLSLPDRLHLLTPGMATREILQTLRLSGYRVQLVRSEPGQKFGYQLICHPDCSISLLYDNSKNPPTFLNARLEGEGWKRLPR